MKGLCAWVPGAWGGQRRGRGRESDCARLWLEQGGVLLGPPQGSPLAGGNPPQRIFSACRPQLGVAAAAACTSLE